MTSVSHKDGVINFEDLNSAKNYDPKAAYNQSKLALILFTMELARRLEGKSAPSRIDNVTSVSHKDGVINFEDLNSAKNYDPKAAYNQSKRALILFTMELARRLQGKSAPSRVVNVTSVSHKDGVINFKQC